MNKTINLSDLIEQVKKALLDYGLSKKTMESYKSFAFKTISNYHEKAKNNNYSEELTWQFVLESRKKYENGEIGHTKFRTIRRTAFLLKNTMKQLL